MKPPERLRYVDGLIAMGEQVPGALSMVSA